MVIFVDLGELEGTFRKTAMRKFGYSKGAIRKAAAEAMGEWCEQNDAPSLKDVDPVSALRGILKGKADGKTSVELQHEAMKLFYKG